MNDPQPRWELSSVADLLADVPYLLGFHPSDSGVVVGFADLQIHLVARLGLPDPATPPAMQPAAPAPAGTTAAVLHDIAKECAAHDVTDVVVLGYGDEAPVLALFDAATAVFTVRGLTVIHLVRVSGGRYVEHDRQRPADAGDGVPFDLPGWPGRSVPPATHPPAAEWATLTAMVAPLTGDAATAMADATDAVLRRLHAVVRGTSPQTPLPPAVPGTLPDGVADRVLQLGHAAVDTAVRVVEQGGTLDDATAADLIVLLRGLPTRQHAFVRTDGDDPRHLRLWLDLTRRATPGFVAGPACLAAYAAWRTYQPALARLAVDRALADDPGNRLAALIDVILSEGVPPALAEQISARRQAYEGQ